MCTPSASPVQLSPAPQACEQCGSTDDVQEFTSVRWEDFSEEVLLLCTMCCPEPDACPEHPAGCPIWAHGGAASAASAPTPKVANLHQHPDTGEVHALSSNGRDVYIVRNTIAGTWTCTCLGFANYGRCYHALDAAVRFSGFIRRPLAVIVPDSDPDPPTPAAPAICAACTLYGDDPACSCRQAAA